MGTTLFASRWRKELIVISIDDSGGGINGEEGGHVLVLNETDRTCNPSGVFLYPAPGILNV